MRVLLAASALSFACAACGGGSPPPTYAAPGTSAEGGGPAHAASGAAYQVGSATWYGARFAGRRTASGERFDPRLYTAAHRKLPFGTWVEVRHAESGRTVRVRINDRGPFGHAGRIIDLSQRAAEDLGIVRAGIARVEIRLVGGP